MQNNNQRSLAALRTLLDTNVHVLGNMDDDGGNLRVQNGKAHYGTVATPFFSSLDVLQQSVDFSQAYLSMPARTLFELLPNTDFLLNPRSIDRQALPRELVQQLLKPQTMVAKFRSLLSLR